MPCFKPCVILKQVKSPRVWGLNSFLTSGLGAVQTSEMTHLKSLFLFTLGDNT